jgi:hypothetical protein
MHPQQSFMQVDGTGDVVVDIGMIGPAAINYQDLRVIKMICQPFCRYPSYRAAVRIW